MDYLGAWRERLPDALRAFAGIDDDPTVSLQYGVLAGSVLWAVRNDAASPELGAVLTVIAEGADTAPLIAFLPELADADPLQTARLITDYARADHAVRELLDRVVLRFLDDYLRFGLLRRTPSGITVTGDVTGTNVVIGGHQYIGGDLVITRERSWSCPTAPNPPPHFAGRRDEIERIEAALGGRRSVAVTGVQGMGGIGKTALVLQTAAELDGFGVVLWASLGPEPSVVNHLVGWARHSDDSFEAGDSSLDVLTVRVQSALTRLVRDHCTGQVLVILDDVWEGESVAAARILQRAAPAGAAYLITTRSQRVVAQLRSTRLELGPMHPTDALQMLRNLLDGQPEIADADLTALAEVVGYHPLALELAAGQVQLRERPADEISDLIENYRRGVPAGSPFGKILLELGETREDNLDAVLAYSYDSLSEIDRAHFRALGILAYGAPFDRGVCAALWRQDAAQGLDELRHRAMLGIAPDVGWYQQHQLLRAYARALLDRDKTQRALIADRYSEYLVGITGQFATLSADGWREIEPFLPHVEEVGAILVAASDARQGAATGGELVAEAASRGLTFAVNVRHLLARRRELRHVEWLELGLSIARQRMDLGHVSLFLNELGQDDLFRGRQQDAIRRLNEARTISERTDDQAMTALTYVSLAVFFLSSDPEVAPRYLRQAVELYEALGDAAGAVTALLHLARWHTTLDAPHEQRKAGEAVLTRAAEVAAAAGSEEGEAEALLQIGRLYDTTGRRAEALPLLEETTERLRRLGRSDLEALGWLFTALTAAALGRLHQAEECLRTAVPLFRATGHGAGLATVLRNLAELRTRDSDLEAALDLFADALPLVRRVTMEFVDIDYRDQEIAAPFFSAQYEEVVKLDLVEAFRARAADELALEADELASGSSPVRGWIAEECIYILLRETGRAATADAAGKEAWTAALGNFITRLTALAPAFDGEKTFAVALRALVVGGSPEPDADSVYRSYVDHLRDRIKDARTRAARPLIDDEYARQHCSKTLAARLFQPEEARDWAIHLRRQRRLAGQWGDYAERDFYHALAQVLAGRPTALPPDNPYRSQLDWLFAQYSDYEMLPLDRMLRETVAAALDPGERDGWLAWLKDARERSLVAGSPGEDTLLAALAALAAGEDAVLAADHPFHAAFGRARNAVGAGVPLIVPLPPAQVQYLIASVAAARTTKPKTVDVVQDELEGRKSQALRLRDGSAAAFYDALLDILGGNPAQLPGDNPYSTAVALAAESIVSIKAVAPGGEKLPAEQLETLTTATAMAAAPPSPRLTAAAETLNSYRARYRSRGPDWEAETTLVDRLLATVTGQSVPPGGPYASFLEKAAATVARHRHIRKVGGKLDPMMVDDLLRRTAENVTGPKTLLDREIANGNLATVLTNSEFAAATAAQRQWATALAQQRAELVAGKLAWPAEVALLDALIAITDGQPVRLTPENPYYAAVRELMAAIDFTPGTPYDLQLSALASDASHYTEELRDHLSGRSQVVERLDGLMTGVVEARTVSPGNRVRRSETLKSLRAWLISSSSRFQAEETGREIAFLDALANVLHELPATLPPDHLYRPHLDSVQRAITAFYANPVEPGQFPGQVIADLSTVTGAVISVASQNRDEWHGLVRQLRSDATERHLAAEAVGFLDALLIIMEGRPADLPLENRYRPFLQLTLKIIRSATASPGNA